jgi:hypothetical protein
MTITFCLIISVHNSFIPLGRTYLVEIEHQVQLTNVPKERIQNLHKEMDSLQIRKLVIICVHTGAKEESRIATVDDLGGVSELDEVRLVFLVTRGYEAVDLVGGCQ